jgi:hypothetical protein
MKYSIEVDDHGKRYWCCHHPSGEMEPLPASFTLQINADVREVEGGIVALPIGTVVEIKVPSDPKKAEEEALLRLLVRLVRDEADKRGHPMTEGHATTVLRDVAMKVAEQVQTRAPVVEEFLKGRNAKIPTSVAAEEVK